MSMQTPARSRGGIWYLIFQDLDIVKWSSLSVGHLLEVRGQSRHIELVVITFSVPEGGRNGGRENGRVVREGRRGGWREGGGREE